MSVRWSEDELQECLDENEDVSLSSESDENADAERVERIEFTITTIPPTFNQLLRMHWSDRTDAKETWTALIQSKTSERIRTPVRLEYNRVSSQTMDIENLYASLKVPIDALVRANVLPDDDPSCICSISATQTHASSPRTEIALISET